MSVRGGIDLGGTKIQAVIVDDKHNNVGESRHPTPQTGGPPAVAAAIANATKEAAAQAGVETSAMRGLGVGSPGEIDAAKGTVTQARNLPDWLGSFPLGPELEKELGCPVRLGNDVQVATDAEYQLGAGKPYDSVLGVFWGTGVGGGIVLDGKPWHGRGAAGEIGHVVVRIGGRRCGCGRRGCMEAYAGRASMERRARKLHKKGRKTDLLKIMRHRGRDRMTSGVWARAVKHGDKLAIELIDEAVEALGAGVASALNVLDVDAVIIGGGLGVRFGEPMAKRIEKAMMPHLFTSANPAPVHLAQLGDLGGAIGASLLVADLKPPRARSTTRRRSRAAAKPAAKPAARRRTTRSTGTEGARRSADGG
jgi:glucokinase